LAGFKEPVDLVGHNWGGGHVVNTVMHRPELVRSWASDVVAVFDPDYIWHDLAQVWQTPGDGEQLVDTMMGGTVQDRAKPLAAFGVPLDVATSIAAAQGPEMGRAILLLYRSARQPAMAEAGRGLEALQLGRDCHRWPLRTTTSAPRNCDGGRPTEREPAQRC
jgi:pimeloyl-ACP methyl ester carboxylesterase